MGKKNPWENVEVVSRYGRAEAIYDGVLEDITEIARKEDFLYPVAMTSESYGLIEDIPDGDPRSVKQRTHIVLNALRLAVRGMPRNARNILFNVSFGEGKGTMLKAVCGPGDFGESVITIMYPYED